MSLNYVEFDGPHKGNKNDLTTLLKEQPILALFCEMNVKYCIKDELDAESLDKSPSVDLKRIDMLRLPLYLRQIGGTSTKNMVHMG